MKINPIKYPEDVSLDQHLLKLIGTKTFVNGEKCIVTNVNINCREDDLGNKWWEIAVIANPTVPI